MNTPSTRRACFEIVREESTQYQLVIRDVGPWDQHPTVTNDAEDVVDALIAGDLLQPRMRLLYYDSEGQLAQIIVRDGAFAGFRPCHAERGVSQETEEE